MKINKIVAVVSLTLVVALALDRLFAQSGYDLFQKALAAERADGNLKEAIALYERVVQDFGSDRSLAANALVRMAECYEKLGDVEAKRVYERVVREFADQQEAVATARARLGRSDISTLATTTAGRRLWTLPAASGLGYNGSAISPDGRLLMYFDKTIRSDLVVHDLVTGRDQRISNSTNTAEYVLASAISRDGKQVAYTFVRVGVNRGELRIASLEGTGPPQSRLLFANEDVSWPTPFDWSPDGNWIAVQSARGDGSGQLGLISVRDGSLRVLKSSEWRGASQLFFSPDGKYLGFDLPVGETTNRQRDVFMLAVDGSREIPAVVNSSDDTMMGWSTDGKYLLFASDRKGTVGLWALAIADGRPQGTPELIKPDIPRLSLGVSASGGLHVGVGVGSGRDIQVSTVDFETGKLVGKPVVPVERSEWSVGNSDFPDWSRDGKLLSYFSRRDFTGRTRVLEILSVDTGQVREVQPRLSYFEGPRWGPDGRSLMVIGNDLKNVQGLYRIDVQSGEAIPVGRGRDPQLSPDGNKLYSRVQADGMVSVLERDLASGDEKEILQRKTGPAAGVVGGLALSPDGRSMATIYEDESTQSRVVLLVPVSGGEPRELLRVREPDWLYCLAWTPDGRAVIVTRVGEGGFGRGQLLVLVPAAGGQPRTIDVGTPSAGCPAVHPDGRQVAFVAPGDSKSEVWVLENFLSSLNAKQ